MEEDKPVLQKQGANRLLFLRSKKKPCPANPQHSIVGRGAPGSARPTGCMRIRRTYCAAGGSCCRAVADAGPYRRGFILFVPSASPSHRHMKALCRERRPRRSASGACHRGRFSLTTFSHGKRKTCHPAPSPPPPPANPRVFCRRLFLANSPRIRYNIPASGRGRGCPLFVFRSSASLRARRGGAISLSHRSVISYV